MRLLSFLPWQWLCALAVTATFLLGIYQLSTETRYYTHRMFMSPIQSAFRSLW
jgi:hypothetical protein